MSILPINYGKQRAIINAALQRPPARFKPTLDTIPEQQKARTSIITPERRIRAEKRESVDRSRDFDQRLRVFQRRGGLSKIPVEFRGPLSPKLKRRVGKLPFGKN